MAPSTDKVKGVKELQAAEDDDQILGQASKSKDRVYLAKKMERNQLRGLVSGTLTPADFLSNQELSSDNILLVKKMIQHCLSTHTEITRKFPSDHELNHWHCFVTQLTLKLSFFCVMEPRTQFRLDLQTMNEKFNCIIINYI